MRERQRRAQQQYAREEQRARKWIAASAQPLLARKGSGVTAAVLPFVWLAMIVARSLEYCNSTRHGFDEHSAYRLCKRVRLHWWSDARTANLDEFEVDE